MSEPSPQIYMEDIYELLPIQPGMRFQPLPAPRPGVLGEQQAMRLPNAVPLGLFARAWRSGSRKRSGADRKQTRLRQRDSTKLMAKPAASQRSQER